MKQLTLCCVFLLAASAVSAQAPPNDTCAGAITLICAFPGSDTTNTILATNDYDQNGACTGYSSGGPDITYRVVLGSGVSLQATLDSQSYDSSLYLIRDCSNPAGTCVAGADNFPPRGPSPFPIPTAARIARPCS